MARVFNPAGIVFKGSGFYITDYRSEGYKKKAGEASKPAESSSTKSESTKTESKPAAKPAAKSD